VRKKNRLYYGDNLDVLRRHIAPESVDLVYLDPPFNSNQDYNVLFREQGTKDSAQIRAFEDTWKWGIEAEEAFRDAVKTGGPGARALTALRGFLGQSDMMAYLAMMAPRLAELRRAMKTGASIVLHCDPNASHYLKMVMDSIFGPGNFRNEIIWQRTVPKSLMTRRLPTNHDVLLFYVKDQGGTWNDSALFRAYDHDALDEKTLTKYSQVDDDGRRYQLTSLLNPNQDRPNLTYEFLGVTRVWRWTKPRMEEAFRAGLVVQSKRGSPPRYKRYLDEQRGKPLGDVWVDIPPVNSQATERMGYPTQKPEALLERLMSLCTNEGDIVLDPFCGCGTTIAVAQRLRRTWIGIDVTHIAVNVLKHRLLTHFAARAGHDYLVIGEPKSLPAAHQLATEDRHQFEHWALGLVGARASAKSKGADHGIDGRLYFYDDHGDAKGIVVSVKSGKTSVAHVRDLRGVIERERATIGVLITLQDGTQPMRAEAAAAGLYDSPWGTRHPRLQVLTVEGLLNGADIDRPPTRALAAPKQTKEMTAATEPLFTGQLVQADTSRAPSARPTPMVSGGRKGTKRAASVPSALPLVNGKGHQRRPARARRVRGT